MLFVVSDNVETEEAFNFAFIDYFDFARKISDYSITEFDRGSGN